MLFGVLKNNESTNISELIKALFAMFILSSPTLSVISSFLSFFILGIIFWFKKIKNLQIKNPFKLLLTIYTIVLVILFIIEQCIISAGSLSYGGVDVLLFGQLYYYYFITIAILTIYTILLFLEFFDKDVIFTVTEGSYAETWASNNGYLYIILGKTIIDKSTKSKYKVTSSGASDPTVRIFRYW